MQNQTIIKAETFTFIYVEKEDRLLLTINYQDVQNRVDFWITRAYLLKLLPYFFEFTSLEEKKETLQTSPLPVTPTDNSTFLLTQQRPILLESMDFTRVANMGMKLVFKNIEKQIYCTCILGRHAFNDFINMFVTTPPKYDRGINF